MKARYGVHSYKEINRFRYIIITAGAIVCLTVFIIDISTGPSRLKFATVVKAIFTPGNCEETTRVIIWRIRMPIALMALVIGASLSLAGSQMQTILSNPLASPYTLGISSGAGFGAALVLVTGVNIFNVSENFIVPLNSFVFSLLTCLLILLITRLKGVSSETMILSGIALLFLFSALLAMLQYFASEEELQAIIFWLFGSLLKATWTKLYISSSVFFIIFVLILKDAWKLTALRLGNERARSVGVNVDKLRVKILIYISVLTATAVCFVGTIGFIGLVGPHIARILVGEDQRFFIIMSSISGAFLLSIASVGSKLIIPGVIFPIGIVTSLIGVPFFVSLILFKKRMFW